MENKIEEFGCHCDLGPDEKPDFCVIDTKEYHDCIFAKAGMKKEDCKYWKKIKNAKVSLDNTDIQY